MPIIGEGVQAAVNDRQRDVNWNVNDLFIYTEILTINYTNIIRRTVSDQREEMVGYSDMNVQSSNLKIQSVG